MTVNCMFGKCRLRLYTAKLCKKKKVPSKQSFSTATSVHEAHFVFLWCFFPLQTDRDRQNFLLYSCVFWTFGRCAIDSKSEDADLRRATVLCLERRWLLEEIPMQPLSQHLDSGFLTVQRLSTFINIILLLLLKTPVTIHYQVAKCAIVPYLLQLLKLQN